MNDQKKTTALTSDIRKRLTYFGTAAVLILVAAGVVSYLMLSSREISIADSSIAAPLIALSPISSGRLNAVYVNPDDTVAANQAVALVGTEVVKAKVAGLVVATNDTVGAQVAAGTPVVTMIDPSQLRVVGQIDENKGLAQIQVGDPVDFTVDAYGGRTFHGVVDEIAPTSNQSGVLFNISNERATQQFDVKARFDTTAYPYLHNGMSARMYVYTK